MTNSTEILLDEKKIQRALKRIAHEIIERNAGAEKIAIIGILTRGAHLARRIAAMIEEIESIEIPVGFMDISLYRDDVHSNLDQPLIQRTDILFPVKGKHIILVDDVLFSGRTVRAALDQIIDFGRPQTIQLAVLIDRGHRELPIKADYVGANIPTSHSDKIVLTVIEKEGQDQVYIERQKITKTKKQTNVKKSSVKKKGGKK